MRIALVGLYVLLAGLSARQQAIWADNQTLWTHAVAVTPRLARPAINLAIAYRSTGQFDRAADELLRAVTLTNGDPRESEWRALIRQELIYLDTIGFLICDQPRAQPYCS